MNDRKYKVPVAYKQVGFTLVELLIAVAALLALSVVGGCIYVAVHFIAKYW